MAWLTIQKFLGILIYIGLRLPGVESQGNCTDFLWVRLPLANATNGVVVTSSNVNTCQSTCAATSGCFGVAFDGRLQRCYQNTASDAAISYNSNWLDLEYYSLIREFQGCRLNVNYTWNGVNRTHGSGGTNTFISNVNNCIKFCHENSICTAVDWNSNDKSCWYYSQSPTLLYDDGNYFFNKVDKTFYQQSTTGPTLSGASSTTPLSSTTTAASPLPVPTVSGSSTTTKPGQGSSASATATLRPTPMLPSTSSSTPGKTNSSAGSNVTSTITTTVPTSPKGTTNSGNGTNFGGPAELSAQYDESATPLAIKPAYIVLAGLGGGCILSVIIAVIILWQYPLNGSERHSKSGTLAYETGNGYSGGHEIGLGEADNVEQNPYYNKSEYSIQPDFTKEENIM